MSTDPPVSKLSVNCKVEIVALMEALITRSDDFMVESEVKGEDGNWSSTQNFDEFLFRVTFYHCVVEAFRITPAPVERVIADCNKQVIHHEWAD